MSTNGGHSNLIYRIKYGGGIGTCQRLAALGSSLSAASPSWGAAPTNFLVRRDIPVHEGFKLSDQKPDGEEINPGSPMEEGTMRILGRTLLSPAPLFRPSRAPEGHSRDVRLDICSTCPCSCLLTVTQIFDPLPGISQLWFPCITVFCQQQHGTTGLVIRHRTCQPQHPRFLQDEAEPLGSMFLDSSFYTS